MAGLARDVATVTRAEHVEEAPYDPRVEGVRRRELNQERSTFEAEAGAFGEEILERHA